MEKAKPLNTYQKIVLTCLGVFLVIGVLFAGVAWVVTLILGVPLGMLLF